MTSGTYPWLFVMLRFPEKNDVRFVFTFSCLQEDAFLIYVISVCLRIVLSTTYCVVFLFCLSSSLCTLCCQFLWIVHLFYCPFRILQRLIMTKYLHLQKYSKLHTCANKKIQSNSQKYLFHNFLDLFLVIVLIIYKWRSSVIGYVFINCMTAYWSIRY